jgi:predicted transposase YdaD
LSDSNVAELYQEAKAREREKKMEEEKQRKARSEQLDAQLKVGGRG